MDKMNLPNKPSGSPGITKSHPLANRNKTVQIRLTITPSKCCSTSSTAAMDTAEETSAVATASPRKEPVPGAPSTQKKRSNTPNETDMPKLSDSLRKISTPKNTSSTPKNFSNPQSKASTISTKPSLPPRKSLTPKQASPASMLQTNSPRGAVTTPNKPLVASKRYQASKQSKQSRETASPSPSCEYGSPFMAHDSTSPTATARPATPSLKLAPSTKKRSVISIPKAQILCCKSIRPVSKVEKEGHDNLLTFVKSFCGMEVESISSIKNVYGVIWQEFNFIIGINIYNPNTKALEVKFYGGEGFSKSKVVEITPPTRPVVLTPSDAEVTNEECLIRVDCGVDFNCKSHGHWRFTAYFVKWQAPGEKDRWEKQERLRNKWKKTAGSFSQTQPRVQTANELCMKGKLQMQVDGTDEHMDDGGYIFSESLYEYLVPSSYQR